MSDLEAYPQDLKAELPAYETPAPPKPKTSRTKKVACAAVALYLTAFAGYWTSQHVDVGSMASRAMRTGQHNHHGMKGHGLPHYVPHQQVRAELVEDRIGVPLLLEIELLDKLTSAPIENMAIDVWHADASGAYSGDVRKSHKGRKGPHSKHDETRKGKGEKHHDEFRKAKGEKHHDSHSKDDDEHDESESRGVKEHHGEKASADEESKVEHSGEDSEHRRPSKDDKHHGPHPPKDGHGGKHHGPPKDHKKHGKHNCTESLFDLLRPTEKSLESEWLRGVQETGAEGRVHFSTIFPGADEHRAPHIHFKVSPVGEKVEFKKGHGGRHAGFTAGEFVFDADLVSQVLSLPEYSHSFAVSSSSSHKFHHEQLAEEIAYVQEGNLESGLKVKMTIYVDAPESRRDEGIESE